MLNGRAFPLLIGRGPWATTVKNALDVQDDVMAVKQVGSDWRDTDLDGIDCVVIACRADVHGEIAEYMICHGMPCFIEKPVAISAREVDRLMTVAAAQNGLPICVDHTLLFSRAYEEMKRRIGADDIARVTIEVANAGPWRPECSPLSDYGPHAVAVAVDLLGVKPDWIVPKVDTTGPSSLYTVKMGWTGDQVAHVAELRFGNASKTRARGVEVMVGRGIRETRYVFHDVGEQRLWVDGDEAHVPVDAPPLARALRVFLAAVCRGTQDPRLGLDDAYEVTRLLERFAELLK